jgi:hypothetical protein
MHIQANMKTQNSKNNYKTISNGNDIYIHIDLRDSVIRKGKVAQFHSVNRTWILQAV